MALFERAHYEAIAKLIASMDHYDDGELIGPALVEAIIVMLAADNCDFDRAKFEADAGLIDNRAGFGR